MGQKILPKKSLDHGSESYWLVAITKLRNQLTGLFWEGLELVLSTETQVSKP